MSGRRGHAGNKVPSREAKQYWMKNAYMVQLVDRYVSRSKYMPHQGKREIARRLRKQRII